MTLDQWRQIDDLFQACLELEPQERGPFLERVCMEDRALRKKIEALLTSDAGEWNFIEGPALALAAPMFASDPPRLNPGQRIGHYEIVELLGRGGMGEVYLARDETLRRRIALKILPADYTKDTDRLRRFQQEAQAASALNHPNILTVHQLANLDGEQIIATEFVEGETLRDRLRLGALEVREAVDVVIQIGNALAAAHNSGIVHRDIKPENIMLRPDGYVKVLDFGLAKLTEQPERTSGEEPVGDPFISSGLVMGTIKYMSPEQAGGLSVDARSDIFSLGVVLYEMIAGRAPFEGTSNTVLIESILKTEPRCLAEFIKPFPERLDVVVGKALNKKIEDRYQHVEDLLIDLKALKEEFDGTAKVRQNSSPESGKLVAKQSLSR